MNNSASLPILYSFRRCPYAIRARMALGYANIPYELREVSLHNKPEALLRVSPKGTVPVLVVTDDHIIEQSLDIMRWATTQCKPQLENWLTYTPKQADTVTSLIDQNDTAFKTILDAYKYPDRVSDNCPTGTAARQQAETMFLTPLETRLQQTRFLVSGDVTLADVVIFPFIRQFARVDQQWFDAAPYPRLQHWLTFFLDSALFNAVMQTYPVWEPDATACIVN